MSNHQIFDEAEYLARRARNEAHLTDAGVYSPQMEHDACGVGFVAARDGRPTRAVVDAAIEALQAIWHRGATKWLPVAVRMVPTTRHDGR